MDNFGMDNLSNIVNLLEDWLVSKEYEIDTDDDLITKTQIFILRYRRIIGILLLIILLYIGFNCDFGHNRRSKTNNEDKYVDKYVVQNGGSGDTAAMIKHKLTEGIKAERSLAKNKADITAQLVKEDANKAQSDETQKKKDIKDARKQMSFFDKKKLDYSGKNALTSKASKAIGNTDIAKKFKGMREAGFSKKAILGKSIYNVGSYAGEKFKEFSGWLYQILFAIAISIAICMVVIPSLSFFIIGIICFFLLKSKISGFKSL